MPGTAPSQAPASALIQKQKRRKNNYLIISKNFYDNCFLCLFQFPGVLAYNMSKSAVDQFTSTVALGKYYT